MDRYADVPEPFGRSVRLAPPIPAAAAGKMTDEQWVRALRKYAAEDGAWRFNNGVGGTEELSRLLEGQTRKDPQRYIKLIESLPNDINPRYFNAILSGLAGIAKDAKLIFRAVDRCHKLPDRPCGRPIIAAIKENASLLLPQELLDVLAWYATQDPDPDKELWNKEETGGTEYFGEKF